jgi:siroheme synthase
MGVANAPLVRGNLLAAGADPHMPVVIVENGTRDNERAFATTLADLTACVREQGVDGPAVIFVGLDWDEAGLCRPDTVIVHRRGGPADRRPAELNLNAEATS